MKVAMRSLFEEEMREREFLQLMYRNGYKRSLIDELHVIRICNYKLMKIFSCGIPGKDITNIPVPTLAIFVSESVKI